MRDFVAIIHPIQFGEWVWAQRDDRPVRMWENSVNDKDEPGFAGDAMLQYGVERGWDFDNCGNTQWTKMVSGVREQVARFDGKVTIWSFFNWGAAKVENFGQLKALMKPQYIPQLK